MEIQQANENGTDSFKAYESGQEVGILIYTWKDGNTISINHTEVSPGYEGKGIAKELIMKAVEFARQNSLKILPNCTYATMVFKRTKEIQDVLYRP